MDIHAIFFVCPLQLSAIMQRAVFLYVFGQVCTRSSACMCVCVPDDFNLTLVKVISTDHLLLRIVPCRCTAIVSPPVGERAEILSLYPRQRTSTHTHNQREKNAILTDSCFASANNNIIVSQQFTACSNMCFSALACKLAEEN